MFSSPSLLPLEGEVVLGCVDGCVYIIDSNGEKVCHPLCNNYGRAILGAYYYKVNCPIYHVQLAFLQVKQLKTGQPVFSSCSVTQLCDEDTQTPQVSINRTPESSRQKTQTWRNREDECVEKEVEEKCGLAVNKVKESNVRLFSGSHDKCVYCWNGLDGELVWKTALDSEVYSTPVSCNLLLQTASPSQEKMDTELEAPADITESSKLLHSRDTSPVNWSAAKCGVTTAASSTLPCVCACSTSGHVYLLDAQKGDIMGSMRLPGEVFSSPAVVDNLILVGCRDDNVYCIECAQK